MPDKPTEKQLLPVNMEDLKSKFNRMRRQQNTEKHTLNN
jgi:hypothetical protein